MSNTEPEPEPFWTYVYSLCQYLLLVELLELLHGLYGDDLSISCFLG